MAKKKYIAPEIENVPENEAPETEVQEAPEIENVPETTGKEDVPEAVLKVLKVFSNLDEAYVSSKGGVFTKDTKPSIVGDAILYKNPYYKN